MEQIEIAGNGIKQAAGLSFNEIFHIAMCHDCVVLLSNAEYFYKSCELL